VERRGEGGVGVQDSLKQLLEGLKTSMYEVLAILLPGVALAHLGSTFFAISIPGQIVGMLVAAYIVGTAVQGLASWVVNASHLRRVLRHDADMVLHDYAATMIRKKLDDGVPDGAIFDICLTSIGVGRQVYDKFVALRDAARGLAVAAVLAAVLVVIHHRRDLFDSKEPLVTVAVFLAAAVLFFQRFKRFASLGDQVVFGQFIAGQLHAGQPPSVQPKER
jgi:hypothetical protein